jgi:AraC-like DNA-binding protein
MPAKIERRVLPFRQPGAVHPTRTLPGPLRGFVYLDDRRPLWGAERKPAPKVGLLWVPLGDIPPGMTDLGKVAPSLASAVANLCDEAISPATAAFAVERLLHERLANSREPNWLEHFAASIWSRAPKARITDHSLATGFAATHVRRRFRRDFGLGPKAMQRLQRFNAMLLGVHPRPWGLAPTEVPEFTDQSHAIREFRAFASMTPGFYRRTKLAEGDTTVFTVRAKS